MATTGEVLRIISSIVPESLAEDWDNCGLQVGDLTREARGILVSLDADGFALEAAMAAGANLVITHHPLIFNPVRSLELNTPLGRILEVAIRERISIFSAHTNLDAMEGGVNDALARRIGLSGTVRLADTIGRIGEIAGDSLGELSRRIRADFALPHIGIVGDTSRRVKKVAVCGGSGGSFLKDAFLCGADVLITGDVKYHVSKDAEAYGIAVIDIGHFASEEIVLQVLATMIGDALKNMGIALKIEVHSGSDPMRIY